MKHFIKYPSSSVMSSTLGEDITAASGRVRRYKSSESKNSAESIKAYLAQMNIPCVVESYLETDIYMDGDDRVSYAAVAVGTDATDYYDILDLSDDHPFIYIYDVVGKDDPYLPDTRYLVVNRNSETVEANTKKAAIDTAIRFYQMGE